MPMNKSFNIAMPNKPYVDDFSDNNVQAATYIGPKISKTNITTKQNTLQTLSMKVTHG